MNWADSQYWDRNMADVLSATSEQDLIKLEKELAKVAEKTKAVSSYDDLMNRLKTGLLDTDNLKNAISNLRKDRENNKTNTEAAQTKLVALAHPQFVAYGQQIGEIYRKTKKLANRKYSVKINVSYILDVETICPLKRASDLVSENQLDFDKLLEVKKTSLTVDKTQLKYSIPVNDYIVKNICPNISDLDVDDQDLFALFPELKTSLTAILEEAVVAEAKYQEIPVDYEYSWQDIDDSAK